MIEIAKEDWIKDLSPGDIGIILSKNFFSSVQNLQRRKDHNPLRASHCFLVTNPPKIVEANGLFISRGNLTKFIGDTTQVWIFRHKDIQSSKVSLMMAYTDGMIDSQGHYGIGQIVSFGKELLRKVITGKEKRSKDSPGVICSELTGKAIVVAGLPYIKREEPYSVTPSEQRSWMANEGFIEGWYLALWYDGSNHFLIN